MPKIRLQELEKSEEYASYQSDLAFAKELNILRNDFYYQMIDSKGISLVDFWYKPLDTLSGDAYSVRRIDENRTFYLLVDGMGKGISASYTAILMTAFVNHLIDRMIEHNSFSLEIIIKESMDFIRPILLEDEVLSIDYICFDNYYARLDYAKFSMPPFLLQDNNHKIIKLKSNNMPMSKYNKDYNISSYDITHVEKFLFYSDGIVENRTINDALPYAQFIEEDFKNSFTKEDFKEKFLTKMDIQEDDLTLVFINSLDISQNHLVAQRSFDSSLESVDIANSWYEKLYEELEVDEKESYKASIVFIELFMNAFEHGNLEIDSPTKHKLLEEDCYFERLAELEEQCNKKIDVAVYSYEEYSHKYIVTKICDEGEGFDTQILAQIFRNSKKFNGRGVFVSRKNSMGIYFNTKGNCVLFLSKV